MEEHERALGKYDGKWISSDCAKLSPGFLLDVDVF